MSPVRSDGDVSSGLVNLQMQTHPANHSARTIMDFAAARTASVGVVQPLLLYIFRKREPLYPSIAQRIAVYSYMLVLLY